jgi:hypothetical protein
MEPATTRKHLPLRRLRQSRRFLRHIHRSSISQQPKTVGQMGTGLATLSNGIDEYWQITAIKVELELAPPRLHSHDGRHSRLNCCKEECGRACAGHPLPSCAWARFAQVNTVKGVARGNEITAAPVFSVAESPFPFITWPANSLPMVAGPSMFLYQSICSHRASGSRSYSIFIASAQSVKKVDCR